MNREPAVKGLFVFAALYDGILGLFFLFFGSAVFEWFRVTPPNHFGYVQFPAALLIVFALMFFAVARNPSGNRNLIPYGILLKVSYCVVTCFHWFTAGIPDMWKPFTIIDLIFIVLFVWAYRSIPARRAGQSEPGVLAAR
jgi:hypothetical protein